MWQVWDTVLHTNQQIRKNAFQNIANLTKPNLAQLAKNAKNLKRKFQNIPANITCYNNDSYWYNEAI